MSSGRGAEVGRRSVMAVLDVRLTAQPLDGPATYTYEFRSSGPEAIGPVEQAYSVEVDQDFVQAICDEMANAVAQSQRTGLQGAMDHVTALARLGTTLHHVLFPVSDANVEKLVARIRECAGEPLLVRTNEMLVPWELLYDAGEFVGLRYDVARQAYVSQSLRVGRPLAGIGRALLVADPQGDLPDARYEAEDLTHTLERLGATCHVRCGADATLARVGDDLCNGHYDLLHFSGHVAATEGLDEASLVLHGGALLSVRSISAVLSDGSPPMVFVNGCASAKPLTNLCAAFMTTGSKIVIGTRFPVVEESARELAETVYAGLLSGETIGAAVRSGRRAIVPRPDAGWAAFVVHGDPRVRIAIGGPRPRLSPAAPKTPVPPQPVDRLPGLDPQATVIVEQAMAAAVSRGVVTSVDVLVALLEVDGPLRAWLLRQGADVGAILDALRRGVAPPQPEPRDGVTAELSRSVQTVLRLAVAAAGRDGRAKASVADLGLALGEPGTGNARRLLAQAGLPLGQPKRMPLSADDDFEPFDRDGALRSGCFAHSTLAALHAANLFAKTTRAVIGLDVLVIGFGMAGSTVLRSGLEDVGAVDEPEVVRLLSGANALQDQTTALRVARFSRQARQALGRAARTARAAGVPWIGDAAVLAEVVSDESDVARRLLESWDVDPAQLLPVLDRLRRLGR